MDGKLIYSLLSLAFLGFPLRSFAAPRVRTGIDALEASHFRALRGLRLGLITNQTGRDSRGRSSAAMLAQARGVDLRALFAPEHGLGGTIEDSPVPSSSVFLGGRRIPLFSLYPSSGPPFAAGELAGLDALVFDIQDVGVRFYTYLASMGLALEAAKKAGLSFFVLDRPNPLAFLAPAGPRPEPGVRARRRLTDFFDVPILHGMTAGEMALFFNKSLRLRRLAVIPVKGWSRGMPFPETGLPWVPPSPNLPDFESVLFYPGIGIFESSNLSVGRGTPAPFRWVGAPWLDAESLARSLRSQAPRGVSFSVEARTPSKRPYAGTPCQGVAIRREPGAAWNPLDLFLSLALALRETQPRFEWRWDETLLMVGTAEFRRLYESGAARPAFNRLFDARAFTRARRPYLLYGEGRRGRGRGARRWRKSPGSRRR